ncbi:acyltransferase family protein [Pontivivens ytuae]|uniref:Acyltransferase n=1 Tax=Pontivivens ytuae TaxID=2789856 RepID=A0A7S9LRT5_9RHOB|nr:acyltransferase family protein [Pontivivens ytuae]QPH53565.1 acyltransferase [Pontivivens ytuae]
MNYRREIDGLRAVAVLPVILYHADVHFLSGGFLGVDIFFVISGYLITAIIAEEVAQGRFSIARFYERRARRILPALTVVLVATLPFAWAWMMPSQLEDYGASLVAVMLFASNILFFLQLDYFGPAAEELPLLHTWTLAVEEQFYIFFPLLMLAIWRFGPRVVVGVLVALFLLSLAASEVGWRVADEANFYLLPFRAWELLAGSLCALAQRRFGQSRSEVLAGIGLLMIAGAILMFDKTTPMPSLWGLIPVGGTALVILFAATGTWTARLLSVRPMVAIGLISYSAYLWHQPLFAFARIRLLEPPSLPLMLTLAALSLVLAAISWRFVEQPFRRKEARWLPARSAVFGATAAISGVVLAVGLTLFLRPGTPESHGLSARHAAYLQSARPSPQRADCHSTGGNQIDPEQPCVFFAEDARVAVFGDSHVVELSYALARLLERDGEGVIQLSQSACPPKYEAPPYSSLCARWTREALDALLADETVTHVVVGYRLNSKLFGGHEQVWPAQPASFSEDDRDATMDALHGILAELAQTKEVILVAQSPELPAPVTELVYRDFTDGYGNLVGVSEAWWEARSRYERARRDELPAGVSVVDPMGLFCAEGNCVAGRDGVAYYFDDDHLSIHGAELVAREILPYLDL